VHRECSVLHRFGRWRSRSDPICRYVALSVRDNDVQDYKVALNPKSRRVELS
jgi:hypothetical protein